MNPFLRKGSFEAMLIAAGYPLLNIIWTMIVFFALVLWFMLLFRVFIDLFRRHDVSGWGKAGWTLFVLVVPLLGVFIYLVSQGRGMAERDAEATRAAKADFDEYVRTTAGTDAVGQIAKAQELLEKGSISQAEFDRLKEKALG